MTKPRIKARAAATAARTRAAHPHAVRLGHEDPYAGASRDSASIGQWRPAREHPDSELRASREDITARGRDLTRNNGWAAGAAQREVDAVVGARFRPVARPDWRALGLTRDEAQTVGAQMDAAWRDWADSPRMTCDAQRTLDWGGLAALAYRGYHVDGDALGVLRWRETDGPGWKTALRVVDPDLLSNPQGRMDDPQLRDGVELDADGAPVAYHLRREHPHAAWGLRQGWTWDRLERETTWGRPMVVHHFDRLRDGQTRGVSRFAPVVEMLKTITRYAGLEVDAASLNAMLGLYASSQFDGETVADMLDSGGDKLIQYDATRDAIHDARKLTFQGVRIPTLPTGDSLETISAARPVAQFEGFVVTLLRCVAAGLGISYEQLAVDWSKTNYSSARAALVEIWRGWTARRIGFAQRWCQPIRFALLEEAVDTGRIDLPGGVDALHEHAAAWTRAKWIGPGRGFVDPVKEAQAAALRVAMGLSTMEDEAAELSGDDYAENLGQIAREIDQMPAGVLHPAQESFASLIGHNAGPAMTEQEAPADA